MQKPFWDTLGGLIERDIDTTPSFIIDLVTVIILAFLICRSFPVNGRRAVSFLACFWLACRQVLKAYGAMVPSWFMEFHMFTVFFFACKVMMDLMIFVTGVRLV